MKLLAPKIILLLAKISGPVLLLTTNLLDHPQLRLHRPSARKAHVLPQEESLLLQVLTWL